LFFADLPEIHRRREVRGHSEIFDKNTRGTRPRYYLQNFHYQSGGWLTEESAERYDTQVEVLLNGTANAMRRQALPPLHELFAGRDQRQLRPRHWLWHRPISRFCQAGLAAPPNHRARHVRRLRQTRQTPFKALVTD